MGIALSAWCCSARARGDARPDSDYDVAVFLRNMGDRYRELDRLAHLSTDLIDETGEVVNPMVYEAGSYNERTPLMREIRLEGIDL
jgi:predicted nucleotidyltransferase